MNIPSYTTLRGYDRVNCRLIRSGTFLFQTTGHTDIAVENISRSNIQLAGTGGTRAVVFDNCANVLVSKVDLVATDGTNIGAFGFILSNCADIRLEQVKATVTATSAAPAQRTVFMTAAPAWRCGTAIST